jgi:exodeoxyribonuclease VII small subunit
MSNSKTPSAETVATATDASADPIGRFETSMKELEDIVARMERGDLPLEESLRLYERGTQLTQECRQSLESAELRVRKITEAGSAPMDRGA